MWLLAGHHAHRRTACAHHTLPEMRAKLPNCAQALPPPGTTSVPATSTPDPHLPRHFHPSSFCSNYAPPSAEPDHLEAPNASPLCTSPKKAMSTTFINSTQEPIPDTIQPSHTHTSTCTQRCLWCLLYIYIYFFSNKNSFSKQACPGLCVKQKANSFNGTWSDCLLSLRWWSKTVASYARRGGEFLISWIFQIYRFIESTFDTWRQFYRKIFKSEGLNNSEFSQHQHSLLF